MDSKFNPKAPTETDPRFVSGQWRGFWIQHGRRGEMQLYMEFRADRLNGVGRDRVGGFTLTGAYDLKTGKTVFLKKYLRAHQIDYTGYAESVGQGIWGVWELPFPADWGGWHIWPRQQGNGQKAIAHVKELEQQVQIADSQ